MSSSNKLHPYSWRADWFVHVNDVPYVYVVQLGAALYHPVDHVVPFLVKLDNVMAGKERVTVASLDDNDLKHTVPGAGVRVPNTHTLHLRHEPTADVDILGAMEYLWPEFILDSEIRKQYDIRKRMFPPPAYVWNLYRTGGEGIEVSFQYMDKNGEMVPDWDLPRMSVTALLEVMAAKEGAVKSV